MTGSIWLGTEPFIMASRLNMASWRTWPETQKLAVLTFFRAAMDAVMNRHPDEGQSVEEWFYGIVTLGESASLTFERWRSSASPNAALHMASFIISEEDHLVRDGVRVSFWQDLNQDVRREVSKITLG